MVAQGNALGFRIDRCALKERGNPPPFQGRRGTSDTSPGRGPGLACSAPLARQRGGVLNRRKLLWTDLEDRPARSEIDTKGRLAYVSAQGQG